jgi:hypothetical protein
MTRGQFGAVLFAISLFAVSFAHAIEITNVKVASTSDQTASITWTTDIKGDSMIHYGLDENAGLARNPSFLNNAHSLLISELLPATTYHFRVISADVEGNKSTTAGFTFTTRSNEKLQAKNVKKEIEKIKDPDALKDIIETVEEQASLVLKPPTILGASKVSVETTKAQVVWTTDREASSVVYLSPENEFNAGDEKPYTMTQGDPNERVAKHIVDIVGLEPSTTYHFQVLSEDDLDLVATTLDDTFTTRSILPTFSSVKVSRVQETSATVSWTTDVKAKGVVEYTNTRTKAKKSIGDPAFTTSHTLRLADLEFGTRYSVVVIATNEGGDNVASNPQTFITVRDVIEPAINKVKNESTLYPSEEVKIQTIISWETDEPAFCQTYYAQGLATQEGEGESLPKEPNPTTSHTQVVVGFAPATVYRFWMICDDEAGNQTRSEDFVLITPVKEKSIIDVILENFEGTFGWLKNVGK